MSIDGTKLQNAGNNFLAKIISGNAGQKTNTATNCANNEQNINMSNISGNSIATTDFDNVSCEEFQKIVDQTYDEAEKSGHKESKITKDKEGKVIRVENDSSKFKSFLLSFLGTEHNQIDYVHDEEGKTTTEIHSVDGKIEQVVSHQLDENGKEITIATNRDGSTETTEFLYDESGNSNGILKTYKDKNGNVKSRSHVRDVYKDDDLSVKAEYKYKGDSNSPSSVRITETQGTSSTEYTMFPKTELGYKVYAENTTENKISFENEDLNNFNCTERTKKLHNVDKIKKQESEN